MVDHVVHPGHWLGSWVIIFTRACWVLFGIDLYWQWLRLSDTPQEILFSISEKEVLLGLPEISVAAKSLDKSHE